MKGIILAGGRGTRLKPLTDVISKQMLPVYDKPMVCYPLETLLSAGICDILMIVSPECYDMYSAFMSGSYRDTLLEKYGKFSVVIGVQQEPNGIAEAFIIGKQFIGNDDVALILGDNIFLGEDFVSILRRIIALKRPTIFVKKVPDATKYGNYDFTSKLIIEKPVVPVSEYAVVGLYVFDNNVIQYAEQLRPSKRNELEITDINNIYLNSKNMVTLTLPDQIIWHDAGTIQSLLDAAIDVRHYRNLAIANLVPK